MFAVSQEKGMLCDPLPHHQALQHPYRAPSSLAWLSLPTALGAAHRGLWAWSPPALAWGRKSRG